MNPGEVAKSDQPACEDRNLEQHPLLSRGQDRQDKGKNELSRPTCVMVSIALLMYVSVVMMVVLQKALFETPTAKGPFSQFVFMGFLTALARLPLCVIAFVHQLRIDQSVGKVLVAVVSYGYTIRMLVAVLMCYYFLESVGFMLIPATLMLLLRCLNMPLTALIRFFVLGKSLTVWQMFLLLVITSGVWAGVALQHHSPERFPHQPGSWSAASMGVLCGVAVISLCGIQYVLEEKSCNREGIPPIMVIGIEGVFVFVGSVFVLIASHVTGLEDFWDTYHMVRNHAVLPILMAGYSVFNCTYSWAAINVTVVCGSTTRAIVRGTAVYGVWIMQVIIFLCSGGQRGEAWHSSDSIMSLGSMAVASSGTIVFSLL